METQTYVKFWYRGAFVDEDSCRMVNSRDIGALIIPQSVYALEFYDIRIAHESGGVLKSEPFNRSPKLFYGGQIMTVADVEREIPDHDILLDNMRINGWARVIKTRAGHFLPFVDGNILLEAASAGGDHG